MIWSFGNDQADSLQGAGRGIFLISRIVPAPLPWSRKKVGGTPWWKFSDNLDFYSETFRFSYSSGTTSFPFKTLTCSSKFFSL